MTFFGGLCDRGLIISRALPHLRPFGKGLETSAWTTSLGSPPQRRWVRTTTCLSRQEFPRDEPKYRVTLDKLRKRDGVANDYQLIYLCPSARTFCFSNLDVLLVLTEGSILYTHYANGAMNFWLMNLLALSMLITWAYQSLSSTCLRLYRRDSMENNNNVNSSNKAYSSNLRDVTPSYVVVFPRFFFPRRVVEFTKADLSLVDGALHLRGKKFRASPRYFKTLEHYLTLNPYHEG